MLEEIIELLNNPLTNLVIAAIIGVLTNVITAKMFDKAKKLWWSAKSDLLNSHFFARTGKLRVSYNALNNTNRRVTSLSVTRIVFWSGGRETLRTEDISAQAPLQIVLEEGHEILEVRPVVKSNPTIEIRPIDKRSLCLEFEYLEKGQGAVLDIVYSGYNEDISPNGVLKGGKIVTRDLTLVSIFILPYVPRRLPLRTQILISKWVLSALFLFMLWATLYMTTFLLNSEFDAGFWYLMRGILALLVYGGFSAWFWTKPVVPKQLAVFYGNIT